MSLMAIQLTLPPYWHFTPPVKTDFMATGLTSDRHPWIGAENPKITIHEYADYQCFQCSKMHLMLRNLIAAHPGAIQTSTSSFPLGP